MMRWVLYHCATSTLWENLDLFCHILCSYLNTFFVLYWICSSCVGWIQTLDHRMMRRVLYHCATSTLWKFLDLFCQILCSYLNTFFVLYWICSSSNGWIQILDHRMMMQVLYHCATSTLRENLDLFCHILCSYLSTFFILCWICSSSNGWIQTLDHRMMMQVLYHCATSTLRENLDLFCHILCSYLNTFFVLYWICSSSVGWIQTLDHRMMRGVSTTVLPPHLEKL
jgi:hypothetical protein